MTSNKKRIRLSEIIGPAFYETHKLIDMGVIDEAVEAGGRASLKSSYVGTELVLQLLKHPDCHALVTRQVGDTMRDSVYADKGVDAWKAYLAAQYAAGTPVQVCYKLATPVPFTATGGAALSALDGVNTVITDADSVAVSGRADPIKRIADLEAAVASIE